MLLCWWPIPFPIQEVFWGPLIWHAVYMTEPMQMVLPEHSEYTKALGPVEDFSVGDAVSSLDS